MQGRVNMQERKSSTESRKAQTEFDKNGSQINRQMVTLKSLSDIFDMPLWTLRNWASKRLFPLYKVNSRIYVDLTEFRTWLEQFHQRNNED